MAGEDIAELAAGLRARHALGRSEGLTRLFDYLVETTLSGARPKEFEVAAAVFDRDSGFDGAQDASVRVAVHRLRKKLDEFYAGPGRDEPVRLTIPKGEYRLAAEAVAQAPAPRASRRAVWIAAVAALLLANAFAWAAWWATHPGDGLAQVRRSAPWRQLVTAERPLIVVLGDYYIFGEIDEAASVDRLVREYAINSHDDLDAWLMDNPQQIGRYRDLGLSYLPTGSAAALRYVMPVLAGRAADPDGVRVVMSSDVTPEMLKRDDIVYLGFLSSLGVLRDPVFASSRFAVGDTYDELIDSRTGAAYVSQEGGPEKRASSQKDYGYFATFAGPAGNRIVVIAGARDTALMQTAEAVASRAGLQALTKAAAGADSFEALYEVEGIRRANLGGRLLLASPLKPEKIWAAPRTDLSFPAG
ncbi:MAG: helix-turn-helix domain-containing protein [Phenylobacterium sp.]